MFESSCDINFLDPVFRPKVRRFLQLCKEAKIDLCVVEAKRSLSRQCYLYGKGRWLGKGWEKKYLGYDDPNISCEPKAAQVTWTMASAHLSGNAIDIVPLKGEKAWWTAPMDVWNAIYDIAENCGIQSLWRKSTIDKPHLQLPTL